MKVADYRQLILAGITLEAALLGMLYLGELRQAIPGFLVLYCFAFLIYLVAMRTLRSGAKTAPNPAPFILGFAILFRVTLFLSEPTLSDDIYRYVWDGKLLNAGVNPYRFAPAAQELAPYRDALFEPINHKDIGTPYGPLTMMVFALTQRIADSAYAMKVPFILFDGMLILLLLRMLNYAGLAQHNVLLYAWNPLVLVEVSGSGHNDSLAVFLLLGTLFLLQKNKNWQGTLGIGMAVLSKYFAVLFLPAVWPRLRRGAWLVLPLTLILFFAPFYNGLENHLHSLMNVGSRWRFNDSLFSVFYGLTGSLAASKAVAAGLFILLAIALHRARPEPLRHAMLLIGAALLLTTTLQPWYLLWMTPFLCFYPNRAWILLTGLVMLSYHVLIRYAAEGIWAESLWVKAAIYTPFYGLLIADGWRAWQARRAQALA